ncbi:hypothetical protein [Pusillimonas sp.]|uniref:hypothetical protein n=1 Tax=Pusillimonas sp. TaxID=3040095 RepID=UPI0037C70359
MEVQISKATVNDLSELHGVVARELTRRITSNEASAADIGAAIKFLKDNSITASIEDNNEMQALKEKLEERARKRSSLRLVKSESTVELTDEEADDVIERISRTA